MKLKQTGKRLGQWLKRGSPLLVGIFWPALLLGSCYLLFLNIGGALATAGPLVQLSGFVLIIRGIRRVACHFEPSLPRRLWSWICDFKEVWSPSPKPTLGRSLSEVSGHEMKVKLGYPDAETPEEYFRVWKTSHEVLRTGHAMIRKELNSHKEEQEKDRKRDKEVIFRAFRRILHDGLDWEFVAVGWLALGVFLRLLASWV